MKDIPKILGVDFDDTLFTGGYPESIYPNYPVIKYVQEKKREGWHIILVTCREGELSYKASELCKLWGIPVDAVNVNHPALIEKYGDCRKIYCDEYIDDKNKSLAEIQQWFNKRNPRIFGDS